MCMCMYIDTDIMIQSLVFTAPQIWHDMGWGVTPNPPPSATHPPHSQREIHRHTCTETDTHCIYLHIHILHMYTLMYIHIHGLLAYTYQCTCNVYIYIYMYMYVDTHILLWFSLPYPYHHLREKGGPDGPRDTGQYIYNVLYLLCIHIYI